MRTKTKPALTRQAWLDRVGKHLVWYFPTLQVREILSDFREQLRAGQERGRSDEALLEAIGTPAEVAAQLLEQEPAAKFFRLRQSALWGALLAVCFAFLWVGVLGRVLLPLYSAGACLFIPAAAAALFLLLRGPARVSLEGQFPPERGISPILGFWLPLGTVIFGEAVEHILIFVYARPNPPPFPFGEESLGVVNAYFILAVALAMALLTAWLLYRSVSVSIRYFPGIPHAVGALGSTFFSYTRFHIDTVVADPLHLAMELLFCLMPYCAGLLTALVFHRWVDRRRPLPSFFREGPVTRQGWLHRLGQCLLGWFPVEQAADILSDYQEQLRVGLERGRQEEELIADLGRPETVVRDLLAEDPKARLRRRRILPWAALLAVGAWLLLGLLRAFEFGYGGWLRSMYFTGNAYQIGAAAVVFTGVSLFMLLRGWERARLESQFPPEQAPTVGSLLLPLLLSASVGSGVLYAAQRVHLLWQSNGEHLGWGWLIAVSIELSALLLFLLLIWSLARCFSGSIRYLPAAVHATGSMAHLLCAGISLHSMDVTVPVPVSLFLVVLLPYGVGAFLAAGLWLVIRHSGKR